MRWTTKLTLNVQTFGEKIRISRKAKGYTLDQLASLAGCSKSYVWELENRNPPRPSAEKIAKIASVLGLTVDFLMDSTDRIGIDDAKDDAFFRKYRALDPKTKEKIRRMLDLIDGEGS